MTSSISFSSKIMELQTKNNVPFLTYNRLSGIDFIRHGFSTRLGGVSTGIFSSMNLAFNRGDADEHVRENHKRFAQAVGCSFDSLVASAQDHNTVVRAVRVKDKGIGITRPRDMQSVDAMVTNEPGVTLVTYYADCTPLFFVDTAKRAIALAHAGWRGTVGRIAQKVVTQMTAQYGSDPGDILVCIGPAIAACCYEVDEACFHAFKELNGVDIQKIATPKKEGKYNIDLLETNRQILIYAGVPEENITVSDLCTKCNSGLLWSHRATNGQRGTMAAMMCITA